MTTILSALRRRWLRPRAPAAAPAGQRIYAIGDIHGRFDLFSELIAAIERDSRENGAGRQTSIVVLGDFIDRGPESRPMIGLLQSMQDHDSRFVVLLGNHEAALLDSVAGDASAQAMWLQFGGLATLASFGIAPPGPEEDRYAFGERLAEAIGHPAIDWLQHLPLSFRSGGYFFCHGGVRPGVPLDRQSRDDLLWMREPFLSARRDHGAVVVHGHSITEAVEILPNRMAIDTGAYRTGILSAICLDGEEARVIATGPLAANNG